MDGPVDRNSYEADKPLMPDLEAILLLYFSASRSVSRFDSQVPSYFPGVSIARSSDSEGLKLNFQDK